MKNKQAFILLVKPPILGQVGLSLTGDYSPEERLKIYTTYLNETIDSFNNLPSIDLIFSCEERYQEVLLQNHFPQLKISKITNGDTGEKLEDLAHYALSYEEYKQVFIGTQEFVFLSEDHLRRWGRILDRNSHSTVLVPKENDLGLIGLNFPFTGMYEDIVWQKSNVIKQLQINIKDLRIKNTLIKEDIFSAQSPTPEHFPKTKKLLTM